MEAFWKFLNESILWVLIAVFFGGLVSWMFIDENSKRVCRQAHIGECVGKSGAEAKDCSKIIDQMCR